MGEYFVGDFNPFEGYGAETEAVGPLSDIVSCYFMHQWIAIMGHEEEKKPDENSTRTPDSILYEPIDTEKDKKKEPDPDPEPRAEDFYCDD